MWVNTLFGYVIKQRLLCDTETSVEMSLSIIWCEFLAVTIAYTITHSDN